LALRKIVQIKNIQSFKIHFLKTASQAAFKKQRMNAMIVYEIFLANFSWKILSYITSFARYEKLVSFDIVILS
jgi:hypothetical protein